MPSVSTQLRYKFIYRMMCYSVIPSINLTEEPEGNWGPGKGFSKEIPPLRGGRDGPPVCWLVCVSRRRALRHAAYVVQNYHGVLTVKMEDGFMKLGRFCRHIAVFFMIIAALTTTTLYAQTGARLISALTRDLNGNGYLDAVELRFDDFVSLPTTALPSFMVTFDSLLDTSFSIDSLISVHSQPDTVFIAYLSEQYDTIPQTSWLLKISIAGVSGLENVDEFTATDGAGPVIWSVDRVTTSTEDRTRDRIAVKFSEDVLGNGGQPISFSTPIESVFVAWAVSDQGYVLVDGLLRGIQGFTEMTSKMVTFYMTNGNDLTGIHLLSILANSNSHIKDVTGNIPNSSNQKVRVRVSGQISGAPTVGPTPFFPILNADTLSGSYPHTHDALTYVSPPMAFTWARDEGGAIFVTNIVIPSTTSLRVTGSLTIFDARQEKVYERNNAQDLVPAEWSATAVPGEIRQFVFYWNGVTDGGAPASPGLYRAVLELLFHSNGQIIRDTSNLLVVNYNSCIASGDLTECWGNHWISINPVGVELSHTNAGTVVLALSNLLMTDIDSIGIDMVAGLTFCGHSPLNLALWTGVPTDSPPSLSSARMILELDSLRSAGGDAYSQNYNSDTLWPAGSSRCLCAALVKNNTVISPLNCDTVGTSSQDDAEESEGCGSCGSGIGLAFIPMAWCKRRRLKCLLLTSKNYGTPC
ncbi:MAG: hypothetical protein GF418_17510 [Chitinivibrionales bacterium]|nr:hypothetical protein [Chitinivibrionales bacterium]MBD3397419.1 hypothetical protein [Chitinivibrionales bacterium]